MLILQSWLPRAEQLKVGDKARVNHDCGEGRTLLIERTDDGFKAWCHRCNDRGWHEGPKASPAELAERARAYTAQDAVLRQPVRGTVELPTPAIRGVSEWPPGAALWLYRAGFSREDIGRLGIYYHPPTNRVVLPHGTYYQARAFTKGHAPKYLGPTPRPPKLLATWGQSQTPTLTEDMLSAMKVGMVAEGWAVLGTRVSDHMVAELMKRGGKANVWLDPDAAGRAGANKIGKQLRAYGVDVRDIVSERDPKLHTRDEIRSILA